MKNLLVSFLAFFSLTLSAQNGYIRGTVIDDESGETIIGANAAILNPLMGTSTDLDGKFSISIAEGSYKVQVSFISFQTLILEDVVVKAGEVNNLGVIRLKTNSQQLEEVVIVATATRKSEAALNTMKKKSATMMDGISAQKMALTGDGNAVEAAQRVTGVTVEGGKYVYVRGLGDRYSKVTLNNLDIPGLDPDKNSLQMDIFPTSLIDNIVVSKTFSASQPADFTGGLVNIETKSFPDEPILDVSASVTYNPSMHFNNEYLGYEGGETDWLGIDDGTRDLPENTRLKIPIRPVIYDDEVVNSFSRSFNPTMAAEEQTSFMNYSLGITAGNQIELNKNKENRKRNPKLGYIFSLTYKADQEYFDDAFIGEYQNVADPSEAEMVYVDKFSGRVGSKSSLVGVLGGLAYKTKTSKYKLNFMRIQNGVSRASIFSLDNNGAGGTASGYIGESNNLEYNERTVNNLLFSGTHVFNKTDWEIDWGVSPTYSEADDPDLRQTPFTFTPTDTIFNPGGGGIPNRIWRSLSEFNNSSRVDVSKKFKAFNEEAKLSFGARHTYKQREYEIMSFFMDFWSANQNWNGTDPNQIYNPSYIYPNLPNQGYMVPGNDLQYIKKTNANAYEANSSTLGYYVSAELNPLPNLKSVIGFRVEHFSLNHTGRDIKGALGQEDGNVLNNEEVLSSTDFFPSLNLIYSLAEEQNLRFSFTQTIARPSFKELSFAQILDPVSGRVFNGSLFAVDSWDGNLIETRINNFDVRWEKFLPRGQIFSVSFFYKSFKDPIETVRLPTVPGFQYQARNVGDAQLYGFEIEGTKSLDFIAERLQKFAFSGNFTYVHSVLEMPELEFKGRKDFEKAGQNVKDTRVMAGQAPYVVNFGITYTDVEDGLSAGIFYNVKGPTLNIVGNGQNPDIYQVPFHSLNLSVSKKIGEEKATQIDFRVENILNDIREFEYRSYDAESQFSSRFSPGTAITLGVRHSF